MKVGFPEDRSPGSLSRWQRPVKIRPLGPPRRNRYSHSSKNRRISSIEASRILSWPASHLSTVERDTPSSREIRAFFHFDRSAKVRKRIKIWAISRSLRSFQAASIGPGIKVVLSLKRHADGTKSFRKNKGGSCRSSGVAGVQGVQVAV